MLSEENVEISGKPFSFLFGRFVVSKFTAFRE